MKSNPFEEIRKELVSVVTEWEPKLLALTDQQIHHPRNAQNRSVIQILGHMVDSASNNTQRIIHLQNLPSPLIFPNYATYGNNDRSIAIQNFQQADWKNLVTLWKCYNIHLAHVIANVDTSKLDNKWQSDENKYITLREMIDGYNPHLHLHLNEITDLITGKYGH